MILFAFLAVLLPVVAGQGIGIYLRADRLAERGVRDELGVRARTLATHVAFDGKGLTVEIPVEKLPEYGRVGSGRYARILDETGRAIWTSPSLGATPFPGPPDRPLATFSLDFLPRAESAESDAPLPRLVAEVSADVSEEREESRHLALFLSLTGAGAVLLGTAAAFLLSRVLVRPLTRMGEVAAAVDPEGPVRSLPGGSVRELDGLAETLNSAFARLADALERQKRIAADASHELRTPVSALLSGAEMGLLRPRTEEECRRILERQAEVARRLSRLVEDLLVLARSGTREGPARDRPVRLVETARDAASTLEPERAERQVTIAVEGDEEVRAAGNPDELTRAALNLLSNAIRHAPPGSRVVARVEREGDLAILTVSDSGPGIPPEDLPHIFERFYRADPARSADGGSGLGLAIVKAIVEAHGGDVSVATAPGEGTTFTVALPAFSPSRSA